MLQVVYGHTKNKLVADRLVAALQPLDLEGTLYIGYPVLASADEPVSIDALLVARQRGLVAFIFVTAVPPVSDSTTWTKFSNEQDRVYFALTTHLSKHDLLRRGRRLGFESNVVTLVPTEAGSHSNGIWVTD